MSSSNTAAYNSWSPLVKTTIILVGYALALFFAAGVTYLYVTFRPDWVTQGSPGMYAFGDSLYIFGLLGLGCIPPTALGLWFLRKNTVFWNLMALAVLVLAATDPLAEGIRTFIQVNNFNDGIWIWMDVVCLLRTLSTPILAAAYGVFFFIAPSSRIRWAFGVAIALEAVTGLYILILINFIHRWT